MSESKLKPKDKPHSDDYLDFIGEAERLINNGYPVGTNDAVELAKKIAESRKSINTIDKGE